MKKSLVTMLGLVMIVGCMSACGSNVSTQKAQTEDSNVTETTTETETAGEKTFSNDDFTLKYNTDSFELFEVNDAIQLSYVNDAVQAAGSNVVIITKEENSKVDDILNTITETRTDMEDVYDSVIGAKEIPVKLFVTTSDSSEGSGLKLVDNVILMQSGDDVISIESIRTVGPDDETEMTIDGSFNELLETFELNK